MNNFVKAGWHSAIVLSISAAAIVPGVTLAGPGCMNDRHAFHAYHPYHPMGPYTAYHGQRMPYPQHAIAPHHAGMTHPPYYRPTHAQQSMPADAGKTAALAAADASTEQSTPAVDDSKDMPAGETVTVRINGMRFEPANVTVKPGTKVTWVHGSEMPHTITGNDDGLRSSTLYKGQTFSHTFDATGQFEYFCNLHPSMTGSVIVEDAGTDT